MSESKLPSQDDGLRRGYAVGIFLDAREDGTLRLVLDDLQPSDDPPTAWRRRSFFTFVDLSAKAAKSHQLAGKHYASIGELVLARILALHPEADE